MVTIMGTTTEGEGGACIDAGRLIRLQTWLSPGFPISSYAFSHGLEAAVELGWVRTRAQLIAWLDGVVTRGSGRVDAGLFAAVWDHDLGSIASLARAWRSTSELAHEAELQGDAFARAVAAGWPQFQPPRGLPLPVAVAATAKAAGIACQPALAAYLAAFVGAMVSAAVRAVPLGQSDGVAAQAALEPAVLALAAAPPALDSLGSGAIALDFASMAHETLSTRVFRT